MKNLLSISNRKFMTRHLLLPFFYFLFFLQNCSLDTVKIISSPCTIKCNLKISWTKFVVLSSLQVTYTRKWPKCWAALWVLALSCLLFGEMVEASTAPLGELRKHKVKWDWTEENSPGSCRFHLFRSHKAKSLPLNWYWGHFSLPLRKVDIITFSSSVKLN